MECRAREMDTYLSRMLSYFEVKRLQNVPHTLEQFCIEVTDLN